MPQDSLVKTFNKFAIITSDDEFVEFATRKELDDYIIDPENDPEYFSKIIQFKELKHMVTVSLEDA